MTGELCMTDWPIRYDSTAAVDQRRLLGKPLFGLGRLLATPAALDVLAKAQCHPAELLQRHQCGDWGEVCMSDAQSNLEALVSGARLLSVFRVGGSIRLYAITEAVADSGRRECTTLLLPQEY